MDLFTKETRRNPYPLYERVRAMGPVQHDSRADFWILLNYASCKRALNDTAAFSSNLAGFAGRRTPPWMIFSDAPRHTELRGLVARAFTPGFIANLEPRIRAITRELLDRAMRDGRMDFAADAAIPLPMCVIAEMIGIPAEHWTLFRAWSDEILALSETLQGNDARAAAGARFHRTQDEMRSYMDALIATRGEARGYRLLTRLVQAQLTRDELMSFLELLLVGGSETTTNLLNNALLCLMEHPGELARLRANSALLPAAIEEVLRYRSPIQFVFRATRQDVAIADRCIPAGQLILVMIGAANRDPAAFEEPDRFDIGRNPNPHLALGHGVHFCLGAALARLEARIALPEFLQRVSHFESAATDPAKPRSALHVLGPQNLPLRYTPTRVYSTAYPPDMEAYA